jgi:hypothetical protein
MALHFQIDAEVLLEAVRGVYDSELVARKRAWNSAARAWNEVCAGIFGYPLIEEVWFYELGPR